MTDVAKIPISVRIYVSVIALVLGAATAAAADETIDNTKTAAPAATKNDRQVEPAVAARQEPSSSLYGRIVDDTGAPVTDATVEITGAKTVDRVYVNHETTKTDTDGRYRFDRLDEADEFRVRITSEQWVGITSWDDLPRIRLSPQSSVERDFTLERACQVMVHVIDENLEPVEDVRLYAASLADERWRAPDSVETDKDGWATIGGLASSETDYIIGAWSDDYALARRVVKLNLPGVAVPAQIILSKGQDVRGTVLCSDGKPAAGWTITAMPTWWHFGVSPRGETIGEDGSFTLRHILPGEYNVNVSVPTSEQMFRQETALAAAKLPPESGELAIKLRIPSPQSMMAITGRVRFSGDTAKESIWVSARSDDGEHHGDARVEMDKPDFRIHPLPPGRYTVTFQSTEIEQKTVSGVMAPSDDLDVELQVVGRPVIRGTVVDAETGEPVPAFRIRVLKLGHLRGPGYVQDPQWRSIDDAVGEFRFDVVGPGIYQVHVMAGGRALARSEPINTDENQGELVQLKLSRGATLSGTVVDEQGEPVDGARVVPLSKAGGAMPGVIGKFASDEGAVETVEGKFTVPQLAPGKETLKVTHPDYSFTIVEDIDVPTAGGAAPPIVLTRGGTVRGCVFDAAGRPEAGVTLVFQDDYGYSGGGDEEIGRFATAVTDNNGDYEVHHLPEQLCYVSRSDVWNSWGVVRQTILPKNGTTYTLDFGGTNKVTGRLVINSEPFANQRVQLTGENPNFGIFKAYAQTGDDGEFTFWSPPPGKWTLYYAIPGRRSDWARARDVEITSGPLDLGKVEYTSVKLVVHVAPSDKEQPGDVMVSLQEYDPIWPYGNRAGAPSPPTSAGEPFVFDNVPPGTYELMTYQSAATYQPGQPSRLQTRDVVEVTADQAVQEVTIQMPRGTASIRGRIDEAVAGPRGTDAPRLWSKDRRLAGALMPREDKTFEVAGLPAGEYFLTDKDTRDAQPIVEFHLAEGEQKTLDLTPEVYSPAASTAGMLVVRVFTDEGVHMSGADVTLNGPGGNLRPHSSQSGRLVFTGPPGEYQLRATYPGFKSQQRKVTLKPLEPGSHPPRDVEAHILLQRDDE
jgi:hypothetical protein